MCHVLTPTHLTTTTTTHICAYACVNADGITCAARIAASALSTRRRNTIPMTLLSNGATDDAAAAAAADGVDGVDGVDGSPVAVATVVVVEGERAANGANGDDGATLLLPSRPSARLSRGGNNVRAGVDGVVEPVAADDGVDDVVVVFCVVDVTDVLAHIPNSVKYR